MTSSPTDSEATPAPAGPPQDRQPRDADMQLLVSLFNQGRFQEVVVLTRALVQHFPRSGFIWKALGVASIKLGLREDAVSALRQSVNLAPEDAEAHNTLGCLLREMKHPGEAESCFRQVLALRADDAFAYCNLGNALLDQGRPLDAEDCFRQALRINPSIVEAHNNLGHILKARGHSQEAEADFRLAIALRPESVTAHANLGATLQELNRPDEAVECFLQALRIDPAFVVAHCNLGNALIDLGRLPDAEASFRRALAIRPDYAEAHSGLGLALMEIGRVEEARQSLLHAIELAPGAAMPLSMALQFIPYSPDEPRFAGLETAYAQRNALQLPERIKLDFAMGRAMEHIGEYQRAFVAYEEGNRLQHRQRPFDETREQGFVENACRLFTAQRLRSWTQQADRLVTPADTRVPVFIVGMPRSGTTLIEQILASHPALFGAGELTLMGRLMRQAGHLLDEIEHDDHALIALRQLGQDYLDQVWSQAPDASHISDKMPGNYYHLALIHLMLPNAKIIHSVRDALDTCFSCYAQLFRQGQEYSYDLSTLGRQYRRYDTLMRHWHAVLPPGRILDVHYEDNVATPERETRRMLDYLGLPWDPACLHFHESARAVSTASVAQVRQPLYSSSVLRWKHFEPYLGALLESIGPTEP